jgi:putative redox protein
MDDTILSGDVKLAAHFAVPAGPGRPAGLVLSHGLPNDPRGATTVGTTYPELADHIARETGWVVLTFNFRGTGTSDGDFSAAGWLADLRAAVTALTRHDGVRAVWLAGFGHGGTFAVCEAADDARVRGVATIAAPSTLRDWARDPAHLLAHAREMGMLRTPGFPSDRPRWVREVARVDAVAAATRLDQRPLLVLHGVDDPDVPAADARAMADAGAPHSELRLVQAAGHRLRHDPRAVATLIGWLDRQVP